jgi:hypothetical protein
MDKGTKGIDKKWQELADSLFAESAYSYFIPVLGTSLKKHGKNKYFQK